MMPVPVTYRIDTDERRAVVRRLTDALYEYLTLDCNEMERFAKAPRPVISAQALIDATEAAQAIRDNIERTRASIQKLPAEIREVAEAALIGQLEQTLLQQEQTVSRIQAMMEHPEE